jgi:hypothetical protein
LAVTLPGVPGVDGRDTREQGVDGLIHLGEALRGNLPRFIGPGRQAAKHQQTADEHQDSHAGSRHQPKVANSISGFCCVM